MFHEYESKPIKRLAYQIKSLDKIVESDKEATSIITVGSDTMDFKHYEPVKVNDWIVFLDANDIYHCSDKVFRERNIVD